MSPALATPAAYCAGEDVHILYCRAFYVAGEGSYAGATLDIDVFEVDVFNYTGTGNIAEETDFAAAGDGEVLDGVAVAFEGAGEVGGFTYRGPLEVA